MPRPHKCRRISELPAYDCFLPDGIPSCQKVVMSYDEYEVIRLVDYEHYTHTQCALQMGISRTTVTEIYGAARFKLADSIVNGKVLEIKGGNYQFVRKKKEVVSVQTEKKEREQMRIAVTNDHGEIFQHFGRTEEFKLFDVENGEVVKTQSLPTNGQGHGALGQVLANAQVDVLICGGIGGGARNILLAAGIQIIGGCAGEVDQAVKAFLAGELTGQNQTQCDCHHHEENHQCGCHGEHKDHHCHHQ